MSDKKQTFIDPKTGEEIEITPLSQFIGRIVDCQTWSAIGGLFIGLILGIIFTYSWQMPRMIIVWPLLMIVTLWNYGTIFSPLYAFLKRKKPEPKFHISKKVETFLARVQHFRRQRILKRKLAEEEWRGVPATALSQSDRPGPPQPTDLSLTQVETPEEEKPRLSEGVKETTADDGQTVKSSR